jgi:regulator of protease activity HflC (stomatin/prohibitin superfamily)
MITTVWGVVLVAVILGVFSSIYVVAENEYACTVRFSKIIDSTDEAGST